MLSLTPSQQGFGWPSAPAHTNPMNKDRCQGDFRERWRGVELGGDNVIISVCGGTTEN